jgi:transcriptional regulator GlxA family with amidase domain
VSWQDRPSTETTWEQVDTFKLNYPNIQLANELFLEEEGNVINAFVGKTYQRRKK